MKRKIHYTQYTNSAVCISLALEISREARGHKTKRRNLCPYFVSVIIMIAISISYYKASHRSNVVDGFDHQQSSNERVLVVYVYINDHSLSKSNLEYFIYQAVSKSSHAAYYIILQQSNNTTINETDLPSLPSYAHYIQHEDRCYYLGTIGWFLASPRINIKDYQYFIFLNSYARGPYLVVYYEYTQWYQAFTKRLNKRIKLIGATVNCEPTIHVESYFWVMDEQGLSILWKHGKTFACSRSELDSIYFQEIPASQVIFKAGFGINVLMKKYHGIDFRQMKNAKCPDRGNSSLDDEVFSDPFETIFIKFQNNTESMNYLQSRVLAYDKWASNFSSI